jgi:hypothetical protein
MFKKLSAILTLALITTSCATDKSERVDSIQRKDKQLSCEEIMLETNEAQFLRKQANKNKELGIKTLVAPLGYMGTYMDADSAIKELDNRVEYLNGIYEIRRCGDRAESTTSVKNQSFASDKRGRTQNGANGGVPVEYSNKEQVSRSAVNSNEYQIFAREDSGIRTASYEPQNIHW